MSRRDFVPNLDLLEPRLALNGAPAPDPALVGPPEDAFGWLDLSPPVPPCPGDGPLPGAFGDGGDDPFENPFAPPIDHVPGGLNPPESIPGVPPDSDLA